MATNRVYRIAVIPGDGFLHRLAAELAHEFRIVHSTAQIEVDRDAACALAPDEVV